MVMESHAHGRISGAQMDCGHIQELVLEFRFVLLKVIPAGHLLFFDLCMGILHSPEIKRTVLAKVRLLMYGIIV